MSQLFRVRAASQGWTGGPGLNTFYFEKAPLDDEDQATLCSARVRTAMFDGRSLFPTSWTCQVNGQVDVIEDTDGELVDGFALAQPELVTGTSVSGYGPTPLMFLLQLRTSDFSDGTNVRGRAFIGPCIVQSDADGTPSSGGIGAVQDIGDALLDVGNPGNPRLRVWRRPRAARAAGGGLPALEQRDGSSHEVTSTTVPNKWSVLRSRRD